MSRIEYFLMAMVLLVCISLYANYSINKKLVENKSLLKETKHLAHDYSRLTKAWSKSGVETEIDKILDNRVFKNLKINKNSTKRDIEIIINGDNIKAMDFLINKISNSNFKIGKINISNSNQRVGD